MNAFTMINTAAVALSIVVALGAVADDRPTVVIVAPTGLAPAAEAWSERRSREWRVETILVAPDNGASHDAAALQTLIHERLDSVPAPVTARATAIAPAILLLGDVSGGPDRFDGLPTFRFDQPDPRLVDRGAGTEGALYVSDRPYAQRDGREGFRDRPFASVGRVPARSVDEARQVLDKIVRYEDGASHGPWRSHLTFVAGEGRFGAGDVVLETLFRRLVDSMIDPTFSLSMTYASPSSIYCPPPSRLEATIRDRFAEPALMAIYLGHGHAFALDRMHWGARRVPMLRAEAIATLVTPAADLPLVLLGCCSSGWYDREDGRPSLAETMLLTPGAPAAIIAGSRMTHPYGTAALTRTLTRELLERRAPTVGELDRRAVAALFEPDAELRTLDLVTSPIARTMGWAVSLPELRRMHARLYNLIGDPTMAIAHPPPRVRLELADDNGVSTIVGTVDGLVRGTATVEIETRRESNVHEAAGRRLFPSTTTELDALESIAERNYGRANERVLKRLTVDVSGPSLAIRLPDPLPAGAALVRVRIDGANHDGAPIRASGGVVLPLAQDP